MTQDYTGLGSSSSSRSTEPFSPPSAPQEPIVIHDIPMSSVLTILFAAWKITRANYGLIIGSLAILFFVAAAISRIPYISVLSSIPAVYLGLGFMNIVRKRLEKKPAAIRDMFLPFEDPQWMNALMPVAISGVAIALTQIGVNTIFKNAGFFLGMISTLGSAFLTLVWFALTAFSGPLVTFRRRRFSESIELNLRATHRNWKPLLFYAIAATGLSVFSMALFVLPFFLVAMPVMMVSGYLTYAMLFEGLDIEILNRTLESEDGQKAPPAL